MNNSFSRSSLVGLLGLVLLIPAICRGDIGNNNPGGPLAEYNGSITTAGSYDPYTGNGKRFVDDLTVSGAIGAYPLKWTRILNTRDFGWSNSYRWAAWLRVPDYSDPEYDPDAPDGMVTYPDGRQLTFYYDAGFYYPLGGGETPDRLVAAGTGVYELIMTDGGRVRFERVGTSINYRATKILDPYKQTTLLTYDSATGLLTRVTEPGGRYLQINRPGTAGISSVQAFDGRGNLMETVTYTYTNLSFFSGVTGSYLTRVNYDDGGVATYTYQANNVGGTYWGLIKTCDDVRYAGPMKKIEYEFLPWSTDHRSNAVGQVWKEKNATTHETVSEVIYPPDYPAPSPYPAPYDMSRLKRTEKRGDSATRVFQYGVGAELESYTDFKGQTSYIEFDNSQYFSGGKYFKTFRDARANATRTEKRVSDRAVMTVTNPDGTTVQFTYSAAGTPFVTSRKDENGFITYFDRDANNRIWRTRYPDTSSEQFTYNAFGQVLTHTMTSGGTEVFEYDTRGLKSTYTPPATESDSNPALHPTRYFYYTSGPHTDRLQRIQDPRNNSTSYEYNLRGQVTKVTHPDGTYTQSGYNLDGTLAWTADENHPGAATDVNQRTRYTYDEYKRVLTVTNPMGETTTNSYGLDPMWADPNQTKPLLHTTTCMKFTLSPMNKNVVYEYDANFRKTYQGVALGTPDAAATLFEYDAVGNLTKTTDPRGYVTTFGYDNRNRKIWTNDPIVSDRNSSGHTMNWEYDGVGNKLKEIRADNAFRTWEYRDGLNRLTKAIDWRMSASEAEVATVYSRNVTSTTETITDPKLSVYTFQFDLLHRKISETYPLDKLGVARTESWTYDAAGNLMTFTNRAGAIKQFAPYDNRNRATSFSWSSGTQGQSFEYDAVSRVTALHNAEADISFGYDAANRKTSETETIKSYGLNQTHTVTYNYDADGNRSRLVYPQGYDYRYTYTNRGQLASIGLVGSGTPSVQYTYDSAGNRSRRTIYYGAYTDYAYNAINQLSSQTSYFNGSTARFDYGFDPVNRIKYEQRDSGVADGFGFDPRNELTGFNQNGTLNTNGTVTGGYSIAISYDANGNRIAATEACCVASYSAAPNNQYLNDWTGNLTYDNNANLTSRSGWNFTYDAQNRLTAIDSGATHIRYHYDPLNRIVAWDTNNSITTQVWDEWNLIEERTANNSFQRMYFHGATVNEIVGSYGPAYGDAFYFQDGRGNVTHLTGPSNNVLERYTYFVSGQPNYLVTSGMNNRFLFKGALFVAGPEIYDMRNRFYLPNLGRFMQSDPIGFDAGDMNLFRYCGNDPVDRSDPDGLLAVDWTWSKRMYEQGNAQDSFNDILQKYLAYPAGVGEGSATVTGQQMGSQLTQQKPSESRSISADPLRFRIRHDKTVKGRYRDEMAYQLATSKNKPLRGFQFIVTEHTTLKRHDFRVKNTDDRYGPLTKDGLFMDGVGFEQRPPEKVSGWDIREQRFELHYLNGDPGPHVSTVFRHETHALGNGQFTNGVFVVEP